MKKAILTVEDFLSILKFFRNYLKTSQTIVKYIIMTIIDGSTTRVIKMRST